MSSEQIPPDEPITDEETAEIVVSEEVEEVIEDDPVEAAKIPVASTATPAVKTAALDTTDTQDTPTTFLVDLPEFSGPLDLLLSLIRDERVDIYDIPIARIAQQFLARIHSMRLDAAAEYLEMAARLVRIKAQMLLPRPEGAEGWEDPRADLVRRLLEYQQVREVVDVLERLSDERRNRFARTYVQPAREIADDQPLEEVPLVMSLSELFTAVDRVLKQAKKPTVHDVIPRSLDVDGAITAIRSILTLRANARWSDVVQSDAEPWQILSVLLALLELAKRGELRIVQPKPFAFVEFSGDATSEAA